MMLLLLFIYILSYFFAHILLKAVNFHLLKITLHQNLTSLIRNIKAAVLPFSFFRSLVEIKVFFCLKVHNIFQVDLWHHVSMSISTDSSCTCPMSLLLHTRKQSILPSWLSFKVLSLLLL